MAKLHLKSTRDKLFSACGGFRQAAVTIRSAKKIDCKNCLDIIKRNEQTRWFTPKVSAEKG